MKLRVINLNAEPKLREILAKRNTRKRLTRKDVFLAKVLRRQANRKRTHLLSHPNDGVVFAAYAIADALKRDNPKFDRQRFILTFRGK